jgi:hypothetical protein
MTAPEGLYERGVIATANALSGIQGGTGRTTDAEINEMSQRMDRLDWMIYFVPQLLTAQVCLKIIEGTPQLFDEAKEIQESMSEEEALCSLQEYALAARPKVDRDLVEIGYPAKFKTKLIEEEGWTVKEVLRRGAFERNSALTDSTILGEIAGRPARRANALNGLLNSAIRPRYRAR